MPEFEHPRMSEDVNKRVERQYPRFVSDRERARRISSDRINPNEVVESKGLFNALDGTTHSSEAVADLASERYLLGREGDLSVSPSEGGLFKGADWNDYATEAEARVASERHQASLQRRPRGTR